MTPISTNHDPKSHNGDNHHRDSNAVRVMAEKYSPQGPERKYWPNVRDFVVGSVVNYGPDNVRTARTDLKHLTEYSVWLWQKAGLSLTDEVAFDEANIRRWLRAELRAETPNQQYTTEITLERYRSISTGTPRRRIVAPKNRHRAEIYSQRDLTRMISQVNARPTLRGRRDGSALLALGAGAGLTVTEMLDARLGDITEREGVLLVDVRGERARTVPVRQAWRTTLLAAIGHRTDAEEYLAWENRTRTETLRQGIGQLSAHPPQPNAQILRATWVASLYRRGVDILRLQELGGYQSFEQILRLMERLDGASAPQYAREAGGEDL
ncbi:tyrosine-type recombinase/integrase [Agromyces sp. NPDC058104]|uniref:tyrosine-type recombinase/integrase n=1 Tax=Agromyces sp. NPDC058104 TaxID=3346342 RepID=UPI0036DDE7B0